VADYQSQQQNSTSNSLIEAIKRKASWSLLQHIESWLCDHLIDPLMFVLPLAVGIFSAYPTYIYWTLLFFILCIIVYYINHKKNNRFIEIENGLVRLKDENSKLEEKNQQLEEDFANTIQDMRSLCHGYLCLLAEGPLEFSESKGSHERITLYAYDSSGQFLPLARYSRNPEYTGNVRPFYPKDQGVISRTWSDGWCFVSDYPDPKEKPEEYLMRCKRDGIPEEVIKDLGMPSRLYCGYRISDTRGREQIAVIITESTDSNRYNEKKLKNLFENKERVYLADLTERLSKWKPNLKDTKDRGL
jgi:hypothetical protein